MRKPTATPTGARTALQVFQNRWAVRVDARDGSSFLAMGNEGGVALFRTRKDAKKFQTELVEHIESPCRVINVAVTFQEVR